MQTQFSVAVAAAVFAAWSTGGAAAHPEMAAPKPAIYVAPDILGTSAVPISAGRFAESLARAHEDATHLPALLRIVQPARNLAPLQQIAFIQRAVSSAIRWGSDATEWGQHDYWASAAQTLAHGAGDMEDRAIVKMQALRALGFHNTDLFLTLATDRVGGPMTVLIARVDGRNYVLDDSGGAPFLVDQRSFEFRPVISFGYYGTWVHVPPVTIAATAPPARYAHK